MFAPDFQRNENGWILFPRDTTLRKEMIPETYPETVRHPAKMNAHLLLEVVKEYTKERDFIIDPFGGMGTTLFATMLGRNVLAIEIEPSYAETLSRVAEELNRRMPYTSSIPGIAFSMESNSSFSLPIACDHIITSPPYGNDLASSRNNALTEEQGEKQKEYTGSTQNIGRLNPFYYQKTMDRLYKKMVESLREPGSTITITHRDRKQGDKRVTYGPQIIGTMQKLGMKLKAWEKWKAPGSIQSRVNESLGVEVILDEDILTFEKV